MRKSLLNFQHFGQGKIEVGQGKVSKKSGNFVSDWGWGGHSGYTPNFKEVGGAYCFWVVCPSVRPSFLPSAHWSVHLSHFLMHSIIWERWMLLFWNFLHGFLMKNSWDVFFSWQDCAPFLSYGPLKKYGCNLVSKISQKLLKLEPWNLMNRLVVMSRQPD